MYLSLNPLLPACLYIREVLTILFKVNTSCHLWSLLWFKTSLHHYLFHSMSLPLYSFFPYNQPINILKLSHPKKINPPLSLISILATALSFSSKPRSYTQNSLHSLSLFLHLLFSLQLITIAQDMDEKCLNIIYGQIQRTLLLHFMLILCSFI